MRLLFLFITILTIYSCNKDKEYYFTNDEAYKLMNEHFNKDFSNKYDTLRLFNSRKLKAPDYDFTMPYDSLNSPIIDIKELEKFPKFTDLNWDNSKLKNFNFINYKEQFSYFRKNNTIDLRQIWKHKYGISDVHNVLFPIYNPKTKIAIIKDYPFKPFFRGCTSEIKIYIYKRVDSTWVLQ